MNFFLMFFYKKYFVDENNHFEAKILQKINALYGSKVFEHDGYEYNFVRCYDVNPQGFIKMERLTGDTLANTSMKTAEKSYHAGVWLGVFHSLTNDNGAVYEFNDFTLHNIIHNIEEKKFTAFDCGWGGFKKSGLDLDILDFYFMKVNKIAKKTSQS